MKLRVDLLKYLTPEEIAEEAIANLHRYKPEPLLAKTGVGYLAPATPEDRARELDRSEALTKKLLERAAAASKGK